MKIRVHRDGDVSFIKEDEKEFYERGYGFMTDEKTVALVICPSCGAENYAPKVISGSCAWCPFEANKIDFE